MNNFNYLLGIGKNTEDYIEAYLTDRGHKVINLTLDKEYQKRDIDFIVEDAEGRTTTLEVKSDSKIHRNGNFFFEEGFNRKTGYKKGWFNYCEAEYLCFYDEVVGTGYILDFHKTKEVVMKAASRIQWQNNTDNCTGYAYLLSLELAIDNELIVHEWRK